MFRSQLFHRPFFGVLSIGLCCASLLVAVGCGDDQPANVSEPNGLDPNDHSTSDGGLGTAPETLDAGVGSVDGAGSVEPTHHQDDESDGNDPLSDGGQAFPCTECDASTTSSGNVSELGDGGTAPQQASTSSESTDAAIPDSASRKWLQSEPLFTREGITEVRLEIGSEGIDALNADSATYVSGSLEVALADGGVIELPDVGMRLKGQLGSARNLTQKAAFLLKMNEFVADQKLLGLNKLALNNMVQDQSMVREQLSYMLFREMGVPAPRTGYARVTLNGELMGLYATVEVVDNASFLDHWFGDDDGNLYEGAYGSDLEYDLIGTFDQDRGPDVAFADLYELSAALDAMTEPTQFVTDAEPWIDLDAYARFAATELFLAHWDGYAATRNNYFLYRAPGGKWSFIPWGTDQTFGDIGFPVFDGNGRIQGMCTASFACRQKLGVAYEQLIQLVDELDLQARIDELELLITDAADEDPRKETDTYTMHEKVEETREFLLARPGFAQDELICVDPANVDEDGDGASGCGVDCDDEDPARNPEALETCNFVDDDCDGLIDELDECESCIEYERSGPGNYAFCFGPSTYAEAQADCVDRGGELVSIHGEDEQAAIDAIADEIGLNEWWIGLSDRDNEGEFEWEDRSALDFLDWNEGEPNDAAENEDCAHLTGWGAWNDINCDQRFAYICGLP